MRPTTRPSCDRTRRPRRSSTRHSGFLSATTSSRNFCDHAILQPVFPDERTCALPRHVDVHVDAPADHMLEQDTGWTVLARLELRAKPLREVPEPVMDAMPRGSLADFDRDDSR